MTPATRAKQLGAKSLRQVAEVWGTSTQALCYQFRENPHKFDIIVLGVMAITETNQPNKYNVEN